MSSILHFLFIVQVMPCPVGLVNLPSSTYVLQRFFMLRHNHFGKGVLLTPSLVCLLLCSLYFILFVVYWFLLDFFFWFSCCPPGFTEVFLVSWMFNLMLSFAHGSTEVLLVSRMFRLMLRKTIFLLDIFSSSFITSFSESQGAFK
jgi:hypothetical protein